MKLFLLKIFGKFRMSMDNWEYTARTNEEKKLCEKIDYLAISEYLPQILLLIHNQKLIPCEQHANCTNLLGKLQLIQPKKNKRKQNCQLSNFMIRSSNNIIKCIANFVKNYKT